MVAQEETILHQFNYFQTNFDFADWQILHRNIIILQKKPFMFGRKKILTLL